MATKKLTLPDVYKKDLRVLFFLFVFGGTTLLSRKLGATDWFSVLFGAIADYVSFRALEEAKGEGYVKAIKG